jgi:hypothetical protein
VGIDKWNSQRLAVHPEEIETFVAQKTLHTDLAKIEADKARVDCREVTRAEFLATYRPTLVDSDRMI